MSFTYPVAWPPEDARMTAFVLQQTDYIYFVYGLSFLLFGGGTSEILKTLIARDTLKKTR